MRRTGVARRLAALGLVVAGLGVPLLLAWRARRANGVARPATKPAPNPGTVPQPAVMRQAPVAPQRALGPDRQPGQQGPMRELHPTGVLAAIGRFDYRFRRVLPVVGLAAVIGLNVWASVAGEELSQGGWQVPGSEALAAEALLADRFGEQATTLIVILTDPAGDAASPAFQDTLADVMAPLADDPIVDEILTYADIGDPAFVSTNGDRTFALARLAVENEAAIDDAERLKALVEAPAGVDVIVTGVPLVEHEFNQAVERDLVQAEIISLPIALLILLAVFGTLVGASLPLVIALMALPSALAAIRLLAG
ncbi:MAG: MMPL family transporter, partial [Candidatus Limnocylindria bacterium]